MIISLLAEFWPYIAGGLTLLAGYFGVRRGAKKEVEADALKDSERRQAKGRDKVRDGRDSDLSPDDRLRRNDGSWTGL